MAKSELTIADKLRMLHELQGLDSQIDSIHKLQGELPMEVSDLEDEIAGLHTRKERLEEEVQGLNQQIAKHRVGIAESEELILKYTAQQNNVKNNREFDALTKEISMQKLDIQLANKRIREARKDISFHEEKLDSTTNRVEQKSNDLNIKRNELKALVAENIEKEQKIKASVDATRLKVEPRLLKAYDRIRGAYKNGLAVVSVSRDACGGCYNRIPPQKQMEIKASKKIIICEHCGRILVDDAFGEVVETEA